MTKNSFFSEFKWIIEWYYRRLSVRRQISENQFSSGPLPPSSSPPLHRRDDSCIKQRCILHIFTHISPESKILNWFLKAFSVPCSSPSLSIFFAIIPFSWIMYVCTFNIFRRGLTKNVHIRASPGYSTSPQVWTGTARLSKRVRAADSVCVAKGLMYQ